jgi:hypothetical protein
MRHFSCKEIILRTHSTPCYNPFLPTGGCNCSHAIKSLWLIVCSKPLTERRKQNTCGAFAIAQGSKIRDGFDVDPSKGSSVPSARSSPRCGRSESTSVERYRGKVNAPPARCRNGTGTYIQYYCTYERTRRALPVRSRVDGRHVPEARPRTCGDGARWERGDLGRQSAEARPPPPRACRAPPPTPPVFPADRADPLPLPPPVSDRNARMDGARAAVRPATWRGAVDRIGPHASRARRGVRRRSLLFELPHAPN